MDDKDFAEEVVRRLNDLLGKGDTKISLAVHGVVEELIKHRIPCPCELWAHPTIQNVDSEEGALTVGALGILNGLVGADSAGHGYIVAVFDDNQRLVKFQLGSTTAMAG